jgi:DNA-binding XRE family transcriptional regulator
MSTNTYTEATFWSAFLADLQQTEGHVIIQSPFISSQRLKLVASDLQKLGRRNVTICLFIQRPRYWDCAPEKLTPQEQCEKHELLANIDLLKKWNFHVNLKNKIHSKFAIIDRRILWEGSLNILSHFNGSEHMRRWENADEAEHIIETHALLNCPTCIEVISLFSPGYPNSTPDANQFGDWLKRNRVHAQLTHRKLETLSGISRKTISQIEKGQGCFLNTASTLIEHMKLELCMVPAHLVPSIAQFLYKEMMARRKVTQNVRSKKR